MTDDFKKWLCEKAEMDYTDWQRNLEYFTAKITLLIKAMWAINREEDTIFYIVMGTNGFRVDRYNTYIKYFEYSDYNNSEQQTLEKALEYIYEKEYRK